MKILALDTADRGLFGFARHRRPQHRSLRRARARSCRAIAADGRRGAGGRRPRARCARCHRVRARSGRIHRRAARGQRRRRVWRSARASVSCRSPTWRRWPQRVAQTTIRDAAACWWCNDARMREVYWARFECDGRRMLTRATSTSARPLRSRCQCGAGGWAGCRAGSHGLARAGGALPRRRARAAPDLLPRASESA